MATAATNLVRIEALETASAKKAASTDVSTALGLLRVDITDNTADIATLTTSIALLTQAVLDIGVNVNVLQPSGSL